jgi:hypothetical protein
MVNVIYDDCMKQSQSIWSCIKDSWDKDGITAGTISTVIAFMICLMLFMIVGNMDYYYKHKVG